MGRFDTLPSDIWPLRNEDSLSIAFRLSLNEHQY